MAKRKITLYFNDDMLAETEHEAVRQDRSISWIIQAAWRIAREQVRNLPAAEPPALAAAQRPPARDMESAAASRR